jgi:hypothetical protein
MTEDTLALVFQVSFIGKTLCPVGSLSLFAVAGDVKKLNCSDAPFLCLSSKEKDKMEKN